MNDLALVPFDTLLAELKSRTTNIALVYVEPQQDEENVRAYTFDWQGNRYILRSLLMDLHDTIKATTIADFGEKEEKV
jgi:hypothetical protein